MPHPLLGNTGNQHCRLAANGLSPLSRQLWEFTRRPGDRLFRDDVPARALRIEIAEEFIAAGLQRADIDGDLLAARHHLLAMQFGALEFLGRGIEVLDGYGDLLARRDLDLGRREAMIFDRQRVNALLGAGEGQSVKGEYEEHGQARQWSSHPCLPREVNANKNYL